MIHPARGATVLGLVVLSIAVLSGQDQQRGEPPRFRVSVEVVRIDAVVTDRDGRIVPDLTAGDFQVFQDGKPQKVTYAQFVPVQTSVAPPSAAPLRAARTDAPVLPAPAARRENIQRTLVLIVDDLGLSVESLGYTKPALHAFVDRELQPSDLVAIVRTGGSSDMLQAFTTDRRILHAAIDALRWNTFSRSGVEAFEPLNRFLTFDDRHGMGDVDDFKKVNALRASMLTVGTLGALNLSIRGLRDLPGRKAIIFASEGFKLLDYEGQQDSRVRPALDRAIDQATRAGVVVYSLDCRGLQTGALLAGDNYKSGPWAPDKFEEKVRGEGGTRVKAIRDTQEGMAYLAEQTGGFAVLNTNDLGRAFARISQDIRDYYIVGYVPEEGTFATPGKTPRYHKITVKVRRPGLRVRTRKEFLGVTDPVDFPVLQTPAYQLVHAAISPFAKTDIPLRATALPGYSPEDGMFVRALLHIDARGLTFANGDASGKRTASADVLGMAFDQAGTEVAHLSTGFSVALTNEAAEDALRDGLAYSLRVPVPRPGAYQLRFALRDQQSGRLGSAGEFVEVPDVPGGVFALSGIVLQAQEGSQALRSFRPGTPLKYSYEIYNAAKQVQVVTSIWRGADEVLTVPPESLAAPAGSDRRFAATGGLRLGEDLPAGSYVLQIAAATADPKREGAVRTAMQRIGFDVRRD